MGILIPTGKEKFHGSREGPNDSAIAVAVAVALAIAAPRKVAHGRKEVATNMSINPNRITYPICL